MIGIISYKDLENWDQVHPRIYPRITTRPSYHSYGGRPMSSFLIGGATMQNCIQSTIGYDYADDNKGWYIIILGNLYNECAALKTILDNYKGINSRTGDVRYFFPGFVNLEDGLMASKNDSHGDVYEFFEDGFNETVEWLQNGNTEFVYSENTDMVLLPYEKTARGASYDFEHMIWYDLDSLLSDEKNIIAFIKKAMAVVKKRMTYEETKIQMEDERSNLKSYKVFIAGSKSLEKEADSIRAAFSKLTNRNNLLFQTLTYEDFERSFSNNGRQQDYNSFIEHDADAVVFVLNEQIGNITREEFDIALNSFKRNGKPLIYVYSRLPQEGEPVNQEIQNIKLEITAEHQYYIDYKDTNELKSHIVVDFMNVKK